MLTKILKMLKSKNFTEKDNYINSKCPICDTKTYIYKDAIEKFGIFALEKCSSTRCNWTQNIKNKLDLKIGPDNKEHQYFVAERENAFKLHGLDMWGLIKSNILDHYGYIALTSKDTKILKPTKKKSCGYQWYNPKGWTMDKGGFYPVRCPQGEKKIYIFEGDWELLKGIQDNLACTSSLFGAKYTPTGIDFGIFAPFALIYICYDMDKVGQYGSVKVAKAIREKFPKKKIFFIKLPFSKEQIENGKNDYCDYRFNHNLEEFMSLEAIPYEPKKTAKEKKLEDFKKKVKGQEQKPFKKILKELALQEKKDECFLVTNTGIYLQKKFTHDISNLTFVEWKRIIPQPVTVSSIYRDIFSDRVTVDLLWGNKTIEVPLTSISYVRHIEALTVAGIRINSINAKDAIKYFERCLDELESEHLSASRNGWINKNNFILGNTLISKKENEITEKEIRFTAEVYVPKKTGNKENQTEIFKLFENDPQISIRLGSAAISPFLKKIGCKNFVDHIWGGSSSGKSFSSFLAASLWGKPSNLVEQWKQTETGRETYFEEAGGLPSFLDESHLAGPELTDTIYFFVNEKGKGRGKWDNVKGEAKRAKSKILHGIILSTGEQKISEMSTKGGVEGRIFQHIRKKIGEGINVSKGYVSLDIHYGHFGKKIIKYGLNEIETLKKTYFKYIKILLEKINKENELQARQVPYLAASLTGCHILEQINIPVTNNVELFCFCFAQLKDCIPVPTWKKALEFISDLVTINIDKFETKTINSISHISGYSKEIWGRFDYQTYVVDFIPTILRRELKREGFSVSVIELLKQENKLICAKGRNTKNVRINNKVTKVLTIKLEKKESEE